MGNYEQLKQAVSDVIKTNGNQEITGAIMQNTLLSIISTVGNDATFAGIAMPKTNPGTPDQNVFYIASQDGIYSNFGGIKLTGEVAIITNKNGSWEKQNSGIPTFSKVSKLDIQLNGSLQLIFAQGAITQFDNIANGYSKVIVSNIFEIGIKTIITAPSDGKIYVLYSDDATTTAATQTWSQSQEINTEYKYARIQVKLNNGDDITPKYATQLTISDNGLIHRVEYLEQNDKKQDEDINNIEDVLMSKWNGYKSMISISVKKDGTGDFTTIQDAINSINDANILKQYDIQVYDDFIETDICNLWVVNNPKIKAGTETPKTMVALVVTKSFVHIRGMGKKRKLFVNSPINISASAMQYVQTIYAKGNCIIANFEVIVSGGRYAIHQESGGITQSEDYFATTIYKDLVVEHLGNSKSKYDNGYIESQVESKETVPWTPCCAQANGTTSGSREIYINVLWKSPIQTPFYAHQNKNCEDGNEFIFVNCEAIITKSDNTPIISLENYDVSIRDLANGNISKVTVIGCKFPKFKVTSQINSVNNNSNIKIGNGGFELLGYSNSKCLVNLISLPCLILYTIENNVDIEIISDDYNIWGDTYKKFKSDATHNGAIFSNEIIEKLPERIGDCTLQNKSIVISVDNNQYTLLFDKDYSSMSIDDIISEINEIEPTIFKAYNGNYAIYQNKSQYAFLNMYPDCYEIGRNNSQNAFLPYQCVVKDWVSGVNCWRLANENENPDGIVGERIDAGETGKIFDIDKNIFGDKYVFKFTNGAYYKVGNSGYFTQTANPEEAVLYGFTEHYAMKK